MSLWRDVEDEMHQRLPIDIDTADRLLAGSIAPEDAPPGYGAVATLLAPGDGLVLDAPARESETLAMLVTAVRASQREMTTSPRRSSVPRLKLVAALATVALAGTTGLAFAGSLPGAAQDVASTMLAKVGLSVPGPNPNAGDHPNVRGQSSDATVPHAVTPSSSGKGSEISALATSTDLTGVEKGAAISTLASGGQSKAGQEHGAPVETPNAGGTGTADTASGGQSSQGTATANDASDGHSTAGSANNATGQSHRP